MSLAIREMEISFIPSKIISKKSSYNKCWWGCEEKGIPPSLLVRMHTGTVTTVIGVETSQNLRLKLLQKPAAPSLGIFPTYSIFYFTDTTQLCSFPLCSQKLWSGISPNSFPLIKMHNENAVHMYNETLFSYKGKMK